MKSVGKNLIMPERDPGILFRRLQKDRPIKSGDDEWGAGCTPLSRAMVSSSVNLIILTTPWLDPGVLFSRP